MKSQLFKCELSFNMIIDFMVENFEYDSYKQLYISNYATYKKMMMFHKVSELKHYIEDKYYLSKRNYPHNMLTFRGFNVVIRQICRHFDIPYEYKIHYIHSNYMIVYYIDLSSYVSPNDTSK